MPREKEYARSRGTARPMRAVSPRAGGRSAPRPPGFFRLTSRSGVAAAQGPGVEEEEARAKDLDARDPLRGFRAKFRIPERDGRPVVYLCGHSLGLQPKTARALVDDELDRWATMGVRGHFEGTSPWFPYHEALRDGGARLVGARRGEVVFMNGLTVNLHLMLASFYRPTEQRRKILIDEPAFPSDLYAVQSRLRLHGVDPAEGLLRAKPRPGERTLRPEDVEALLQEEGRRVALVWLNGVNFLTGQALPIERLTAAAQTQGAVAGWDLAHAAGNIPLKLHDWGVDFAAWCSYKYLNGGPGAVGGCFVHERHGRDASIPRLAGWWGHDPRTRFRMQLEPDFRPQPGAEGWQLSNPPIFSMAPLRASFALFDAAGMRALRRKSERLTAYLEELLDRMPPGRCELLTPRDPESRGAQLSIRLLRDPRQIHRALEADGIECDFREPDVLRAAPVPLYNGFHDVWRFADSLSRACR